VTTPPETKALLADFKARGFTELPSLGLSFPVQCGVNFLLYGAFTSNVLAFHVLTRCAADLLEAHGDETLKGRYLADMRRGDVFGTMALSEPHAGSSLAGITTSARPDTPEELQQPAWMKGAWRIKGSKMWTSGAFHDVAENTCHMLLARAEGPGTPAGIKGVSLFLVPHVLPDGALNDTEVVGLNKKMGHRALPNCAWSLGGGGDGGDGAGAVGWLVGPLHGGIGCMFQMMNAMRIEVGLGAACLGKRGLQESLLYAADREQGGKQIIE
jgi:alkylation response protein AidB-like acyl-CoA dehydrogenase